VILFAAGSTLGESVRRTWVLLAGCAALVLAALQLGLPAAAGPPPVAIALPEAADGQVDVLAVSPAADGLAVNTRTATATYAPGDVAIRIPETAATDEKSDVLPDGTWYVAAAAGETGAPRLGWSADGLAAAGYRSVEIELVGVDSGDGKLEVFSGTVAAGRRVLSWTDATARKHTYQPTESGSREVLNWAFGSPGRYRATFRVTATGTDGRKVQSPPSTFTFLVGTAAAVATPTTTTLTAAPGSMAGRTRLTGAVTGTGARGWVEFFDGNATSLGYAEVVDGVASEEFPFAAGTYTLKAAFRPKYLGDHLASESPAVSYTVNAGSTDVPTASVSPTVPAGQDGTAVPTATASPTLEMTALPVEGDSSSTCTVLGEGDVDYAVRLKDGKPQSAFRDAAGGWHEPSSAVVKVGAETVLPLPAGQDFLGPAGTSVWQLPQTPREGVPSLGWLAEGTAATWTLDGVEGPGKVVLFEAGTEGAPSVVFGGAGMSRELASGVHAHGTWGFTEQGVYRLTFTHRTSSGGEDTEKLTFVVGAAAMPSCRGKLANTGAHTLLYASLGAMAVSAGAVLLIGVNRRLGLF